jgi:hypothetical protein
MSNRPAVAPIIEGYQMPEIIVPGGAEGVLTSTDGCVRFVFDSGHMRAAQFPTGTTYSEVEGAIVMLNGQKFPFGKRIAVDSAGSPNAKSAVPQCRGLQAIRIMHRELE